MTNYSGTIDVSGPLVGLGTLGELSGTLGVTLSTSVNGAGNGSATEILAGTLTATYSLGGSGSSTFAFDATASNIVISGGSIIDSLSGVDVSFENIVFDVILGGSVASDQSSISETFRADGSSATITTADISGSATLEPVGPSISGTVAGQTSNDQSTLTPFSTVAITDPTSGASETVTVALSDAANGTLSNLGGGSYDAATGIYTVAGTPAAVTSAVDGLVFQPTAGEAPGQTVTTTFTIDATNEASKATSSTVSVATNDITVQLHAASSQYEVADSSGSLYIADTGAGGDGTQTLSGVTVMQFTDGIGVFDPTGTAEEVARLYGAALGRAPDMAGLNYWVGQIDDSNVPLDNVATAFTESPEFISDYGALDNIHFVDQLYENVLGRSADPTGQAYWTGLLNSGASRGAVLVGFAESQEYEADTQSLSASNTLFAAGDQDNGEVYRLYEAALGRAPDSTGQAYWVTALQSGTSLTDIAAGFVASAEFQADYGNLTVTGFVDTMYNNVLGRAPDQTGLAYWTGLLNQGASEASVLLGFSDSVEFRADTASATHANWLFIPT